MLPKRRALVTRSQYARMKGRTPTTVHRWVTRGKISPSALIGGKIWVEQADRDLLETLDPAQQAAQARPIG